MQTLDFVSGLHNCREFSQPLLCLYQAMQTRKTFSIAKIVHPEKFSHLTLPVNFVELFHFVYQQIGFKVIVFSLAGPDIKPGRCTFLSILTGSLNCFQFLNLLNFKLWKYKSYLSILAVTETCLFLFVGCFFLLALFGLALFVCDDFSWISNKFAKSMQNRINKRRHPKLYC